MPRPTEEDKAYYMEEARNVDVIARGAHFSHIKYVEDGIAYVLFVDNDELIFLEEDNDAL